MEHIARLAKIVGTASETSWTQAMSLDGIYIVLSLERGKEEDSDETLVAAVGKELVVTFEDRLKKEKPGNLMEIRVMLEYFSEKIPPGIFANLLFARVLGNVIYLGLLGKGCALLLRKKELGVVLNQQDSGIVTSSGILQEEDVIFLETEQFQNLVPVAKLAQLIKDASFEEIAENIAPLIHGQDEAGSSAAIIFQVHSQISPEHPLVSKPPFLSHLSLPISFSQMSIRLPHLEKKKLLFILLGLLLLSGAIFGLTFLKEQRGGVESFETVLKEANKKYEEGTSLLTLNKELAKEPLLASKTILEGSKPTKKEDVQKKEELLGKVAGALSEAFNTYTIKDPQVFFDLTIMREDIEGLTFAGSSGNILILDKKQSAVYALSLANKSYNSTAAGFKNPKHVVISAQTGFVLDDEGIWKIRLKGKSKTLVVKKEDFGEVAALSAFFSNIYMLDKKNAQIVKLVPIDDEKYSQRDYFTGKTRADVTDGISMAIDGSIYILSQAGVIKKYIEGREDAFFTPDLDKPFENPSRLFTDRESEFVYVLDLGNKRIVVFKKNGPYVAQYIWDGMNNVRDFVVLEKEKKILLLSEKKIYAIEL